jgi:DNA repair protein RadC
MRDELHARFELYGAAELRDAELLALATRRPLDEADHALARLGALPSLLAADLEQLCRTTGWSARRVVALKAALELGRRAVDLPLALGATIATVDDAVKYLRGRLAPLEVEELHVLGLDTHNRVKLHACVARGTLNQVFVSPSDVFRPVIRAAAAGAIVIHNHPSGVPSPSEEDFGLTDRLRKAADVLGIKLVDHVVIARQGRFSFLGAGLLEDPPRVCTIDSE